MHRQKKAVQVSKGKVLREDALDSQTIELIQFFNAWGTLEAMNFGLMATKQTIRAKLIAKSKEADINQKHRVCFNKKKIYRRSI